MTQVLQDLPANDAAMPNDSASELPDEQVQGGLQLSMAGLQDDESPELPAVMRPQVSELVESGRVIMPISLTFWSQPETAKRAPNVVEIPADKVGTVVRSRISGHDGEAVNITHFDCQMEATIAQLVDENGLPLYVTPAQIYRKFAQMGPDERVTKKQEEEVITSIDKLIVTPATLDFTQEIQNHTKLKRNPLYDYTNTVIEGTLITGVRVSQATIKAASPDAAQEKLRAIYYKGRIVENVYIIYSMPMYAVHDHMVNQIATFPSRYINSPDGAGHQEELPEKREPTNSSHVIAMRKYILVQITRMQNNQKIERTTARRSARPMPETHSEKLSFNKIAEHSDITLTPRSLRTLRTNTERILNELQNEHMILSFSTYKKGRAIDGVVITV